MSTSDLPPNPSGTPTPAGSGRGDFTTPVELRCVMTPTGELKRAIPLTIVTFLFAGFVALVVIGASQTLRGILRLEERNSALSTRKAGVIAGPAGMVANAGIAASQRKIAVGIVGHAVITPLPDARRAELRAHDRLNGGLSNLAGGQPFSSDSGLVFQPSSKRIGRRARSAPGSGTTVRTWVYPTECPNLESPLISG
ncbi:hypothetical protein K8O93_07645 [Gordonia bronchialis]|uniref:hypothetical protein n=1 Tax=Gordonia bronchialis TaxID=2054 RepID=UPI001CC1501C|nr:hypothetical protein [Gordonia bronchialis]UAK39523.1 hypothetical protein K8O93_07645 [Gordonia bronchialis]